jgi:hypothetical protein
MYVDLLSKVASGEIKYKELSTTEKMAMDELERSNFVSHGEGSATISRVFNPRITIEGAIALESLSSYLKQETKLSKIGDAFIKLLWLFAGALLASFDKILAYFI